MIPEQPLRYGQVIRIHGNYHDWRKGLLIAKSFTDRNVYYQTYQKFSYLNNYRESLFQVLPRGSFEIHDEFYKATTSEKDKEFLAHRLKTESDQYRLVVQSKMNEEILFGSEVVFKHVDSEFYLLGSYRCSEFSTDAFKLELSQQFNSLAVFIIQPYHTYQQEGQQVFLDEPVVIKHEKSKCLVDFVEENTVFIDQRVAYSFDETDSDFEQQTYEHFRLSVRRPMEGNKRYEAVVTHNNMTNWLIRLHEKAHDTTRDRNRLKPFDWCLFHHSKNNSYLSVEGRSNTVILKELKTTNEGHLPLEAVWELQLTTDLGQIESNRLINQGVLSPKHPHYDPTFIINSLNQKYILRHCLSGKVMTSVESSILGVFDVMVDEIDLANKNQLFHVQTAKKGQNELINNTFIKIINNGRELQERQSNRISLNRISLMKRETSFSNQNIFYKSLDEENLDYVKYKVSFLEDESMHAFQLQKISYETKQDLQYIMSSQELLMQFADILKLPPQVVEGKLNSKVLGQIVQVLRYLLSYVLKLSGCDEEVEKSECLPIPNRQRYLKDLYMTELIMEVLYFMSYKNGLERLFKQWKSERERTKQIFKLSYLLIEKMTKNNPQIKLHVSQWLELFLHQAMMIDEVSVQASLNELLDDNYQAISKFITKTSVRRLVDIMRLQVPHEKYLRILSSICICNGKSIISNQIHALSLFFQQMKSEFKFELRHLGPNQPVQVLSCIVKNNTSARWRTLKELYDDSQSQDELQTWNYFISYFDLLGDICANRNKFAKSYVEENFSLGILCSMIENPECLATNAIEPILKIIHFAYIDCQDYEPIMRLARVCEWETIQKENDILRTHAEEKLKPENCDLQRVMAFLEKFIQNFKFFSTRNKNYNQNLFTILQVLKTTLNLGFWKSIDNLKQMLPHLFRICSCNRDFTEYSENIEQQDEQLMRVSKDLNNINKSRNLQHYEKAKAKLTKMNLDNMMVMKCKTLACEILDRIIDMEMNVRVRKATQNLKTLMNNHEDIKSSATNTNTHIDLVKNMQAFRRGVATGKDLQVYDVDTWIQQTRQLINERDIFEHLSDTSAEVVFAEMSLFDNGQMLQWGLKLLNRIYGQRRELIQNFEKVLIIDKGTTYKLSIDSRIARTKLLALVDRNILFCTLDNQKDFNAFVWRESDNPKERGIIQDLNYLVQVIKREKAFKSDEMNVIYDNLYPVNGVREQYTECDQVNRLHQSLLKSQDLHESILSFIEIASDVSSTNQLIMKLLHSCYNYLTMLILNHSENKIDLMKYKRMMYPHLAFNIGCIEFFRELFQNNKILLESERIIFNVIEIVIYRANQTNINNYFKSRLIDFLRVCIIYNNKAIKFNQIQIMASLQQKQIENIMFLIPKTQLLDDEVITISEEPTKGSLWSEREFLRWIEQYEEFYDSGIESLNLLISPELTYMFTYFQAFSLLIEDHNEINAGKCKHMHPFPSLLGILWAAKRCWPLKRYVRAYVNRLYYSFDDFENLSQFIIENDLAIIITDLTAIIQIRKSSKYFDNFKDVKLVNQLRYTYLLSYLYLYLEEILITLNTIFNKERFLYDLEDILNYNFQKQQFKVHLQLFEIAQKISVINRQWQRSKHILQFSKVLMNIFKSVFRTFDIQLLLIREGLLNSALQMKNITEKVTILRRRVSGDRIVEEIIEVMESQSDPSKLFLEQQVSNSTLNPGSVLTESGEMYADIATTDKLKEMLIENVFLLHDQDDSIITLHQSLKKIFRQTNVDQSEDFNETLNFKHRRVINILNLSTRFQTFIEEEFIQVCEKLNTIDDVSMKIYKVDFPVITLREFIKNIIHMNVTRNFLSYELKIFVLKVLTRIITEKNQANKETLFAIDTWTPEFWSHCKDKIKSAQNFLEECGAAELICQLLLEPNLEQRLHLTSELLTFSIAFLIGGNVKCQNSILQRLKTDGNNTMLQNYCIMIRKVARSIYNNFKIRKQKQSTDIINDNSVVYTPYHVILVDNQDLWDNKIEMMRRQNLFTEQEDTKQTVLKIQARETICRSFRVLQLLCENNNIEMKNFVRQQTDSDGSAKLNSINFIEFTTNQLRLFLKIMNKEIQPIPPFMLDFLIEIIQLPCIENQINLCKSTFFEDVCYMSQFFMNKQNLNNRMLEKPEEFSQLQELYNKILIAMMSVLEGNDEKIYEDLQNKLESRFLIDFVKQNLEILKINTPESLQLLLQSQDNIFSDEICKVLNVFILKSKIFDKFPKSKWIKGMNAYIEQDLLLYQMVQILEKLIRKIEIVYNDRNQTIFFLSHPLFDFLSGQTRDKIMDGINRQTQREKILGLLGATTTIFNEIEYNFQLNQTSVPVTHRTITFTRNLASTTSLLINMFMVVTYQVTIKNKTVYLEADFHELMILTALSVTQLVLSTALFIFYMISRAPLALKIHIQRHERQSHWIMDSWLYLQWRFSQFYFLCSQDDEFITYILYLAISILGCLYREHFFSLHLFDLISRLSLLKNVFQAISYNAKQLIVVSMLGVLFVFVFSITGFASYVDEIYPEDEPTNTCQSLFSCMITLSTSGVIGNSMSDWDPLKFLLDTIYFVFFALLFTNIVSGIMIDTFAELRDQRQTIEDDKTNLCFICGTDRQTTEKNGQIFSEHVKQKHFLWNYPFYMYTLTKKDSTEYTGLEYWIQDNIQNDNICWFPVEIENDNNLLIDNFSSINKRMDKLEEFVAERTNELVHQIDELKKDMKESQKQNKI